MKYRCIILTQGRDEEAAHFAEFITETIQHLMKEGAEGMPYALPMSDGNGRKEVLIQWYQSTEPNEVTPKSMLGLANHLKDNQKKVVDDFCRKEYGELTMDPFIVAKINRGYDLCIEEVLRVFPGLSHHEVSEDDNGDI